MRLHLELCYNKGKAWLAIFEDVINTYVAEAVDWIVCDVLDFWVNFKTGRKDE